MKRKWKRLLEYLKARAGEASTWRGLTLLVTVAGAQLTTDQKELIILIGLAVAGLVGVLFPDEKKEKANA